MHFVVYILVLVACAPIIGFSQMYDDGSYSSHEDGIVSDGVQAVKGIVQDAENTLTDGLSKILPQGSNHEHQLQNRPQLYEGGVGNGILQEGILRDGFVEGGILNKGKNGRDYIVG